MKKNYWCFILLLFVVIGTISCKKDNLNPIEENGISTSEISAAKNWYETQLETNKNGEKTNIGILKKQLDWEQLINVETSKVSLIPYNIADAKNNKAFLELLKNEKGEIITAKYVFLLSNENLEKSKIQELILNKSKAGNFTGAIIEYDLSNTLISSKSFTNGTLENNITAKVENTTANRPMEMDVPCPGVNNCIAWYWVVYENGVMIIHDYMFTTCVCDEGAGEGNGGGGGAVDNGVYQNKNVRLDIYEHFGNNSEHWKIYIPFKLGGMKFENNENNFFTSIEDVGEGLLGWNYNPLNGLNAYPNTVPNNVYTYCQIMGAPNFSHSFTNGGKNLYTSGNMFLWYPNHIPVETVSRSNFKYWNAREELN